MHIKHLSLANFRNYRTAEVPLAPGINLFLGENGQGKTNLVEAIGFLSTLKSHRVTGYEALIANDPAVRSATIRVLVVNNERQAQIDFELNRDAANRAFVNKNALPRTRDVIGIVNSVTFAPEDVQLIKGQPSKRRDFFDDLLVQLTPRFAGVFADYERVLKQRNTLLRTAKQTGAKGTALATLDAWDVQLSKYGAEIICARFDLAMQLQQRAERNYFAIAGDNARLKISITASIASDDLDDVDEINPFTADDLATTTSIFENRLANLRTKELDRGITLIGPHRDDFIFEINDQLAKTHASSGETWSFAIALQLSAADLIRDRVGADPIIILDDVFATLDAGRRDRLAKLVASNEQVLITAAVAEDVPSSLHANVFNVVAGEVSNG